MVSPSETPLWLSEAVSDFGARCKQKLAGPGDREAAIRSPLEELLARAGSRSGLHVVPHDEVRDVTRGVRPDYAVSVGGAITGYVEVKRPGMSIDPRTFSGHNLTQWERQRDLPNLIYTNGTEWRLWRDSAPIGEPVVLEGGSLEEVGGDLRAPAGFAILLTEFLRWAPVPITSVSSLVRAVAPLTRLLRGEVLDQLSAERRRVSEGDAREAQPFHGLAEDWRRLLFPDAPDGTFADGYAQTVTFALLLARSEGIDFAETSLHDIGQRLGEEHSLMGRALQLLTDDTAADFRVTLDLLIRVVGSVVWKRIRGGRRDAYLYLYEEFLTEYDPDLRRASGSYYTPLQLVEQMTRLTEDVLRTRLGKADGFLDPSVLTIDPAMGTGTYLNTIIEHAAQRASAKNGPGAAGGVVSELAERLVGFELQMGPYAVAELRATDLLHSFSAKAPSGGMRTFVTNALDDPFTEIDQIASSLAVISSSRRRANEVKGDTPVTVVIGNPPYRERAEGEGGFIELGRAADRKLSQPPPTPLDAFRAAGNGQAEYVLKNLYVYFWRWATWKVFDAHAHDSSGVVCFVTTSGYLQGPGFSGMREYLRRTASEGWIINLTPEGFQPPVSSRVFRGVQQTLAIGMFVRSPETDRGTPARIRHTTVTGLRDEKYRQLEVLQLDGDVWRDARSEWQAPFTPAADSDWDDWPGLSELHSWTLQGVTPGRTWVYAPHPSILRDRWRTLAAEPDLARRRHLFQESARITIDTQKAPIPGPNSFVAAGAWRDETAPPPQPVRIGYRAFDRQWLIPDSRLVETERPPLWQSRSPRQLFTVEQSVHAIDSGPAVLFSALIPDKHFFYTRSGGGGRVAPAFHPDGSANAAPGLLEALAAELHLDVTPSVDDLVAYVAAVAATPAFTRIFIDELSTPGVRIPLTNDAGLWGEAIELGRTVIWLQTYGATMFDAAAGRPKGMIRYAAGDPSQPLALSAVTAMPEEMTYDAGTSTLWLGTGSWGPVGSPVWEYEVAGRRVLESWFKSRRATPGGRRTAKTSPLALMHLSDWPSDWTVELVDLLTLLRRLTELEPAQADLLGRIMRSELITRTRLSERGVTWPKTPSDRRPKNPLTSTHGLQFG